jgi:hypothetical protein
MKKFLSILIAIAGASLSAADSGPIAAANGGTIRGATLEKRANPALLGARQKPETIRARGS